LRKLWDWLRTHVIGAIIFTALSASAVAYLKGIFDDIIGIGNGSLTVGHPVSPK
jgi:hypothetical protein